MVTWAVVIAIGGSLILRRLIGRRGRHIDVGAVSSAWLTAHSIDPREQHR
jgi:hypothetical protein